MKYENIVKHFNEVLRPSKVFDSISPVRSTDLLLPEFYEVLQKCFNKYEEKYPNQKCYITETYRSNKLQRDYYKAGRSKIKKDGMHHFGIATDIAFVINGKVSYKGDYGHLRKIFREKGLTVLDWELGHVQYIPVPEQKTLREEIYSEEN